MSEPYSFDEVAGRLLSRSLDLCRYLLPGGVVRGQEYVCTDLRGGRPKPNDGSLSVNLKEGVWKDFATGEVGADLINLWAAVEGCGQGEAKGRAEGWLGLERRGSSTGERPALDRQAAGSTPAPASIPGATADDDPIWYRSVRHEARWDYVEADGSAVAYVYRFRHPRTGEKAVRPWDPATGRWEAPDRPRPLLYLPELMTRPDEPVAIVGGEKCADAVRAVGWLGTTVMGGESAIGKADLQPLRGRRVVLWRDNDAAGASWETKLVDALREVEPLSVQVVAVPKDRVKGWDAADAEEDERRRLLEAAASSAPVVRGRPVVTLAEWGAGSFAGPGPERQWLVREVFPLGVAAILAAMGDTGKGMKVLNMALKIAGGAHLAGEAVLAPTAFGCTIERFGRVVILSAEDDRDELHRRMSALDPSGELRQAAGDRLMVVPLPNLGGANPFITATGRGVQTTGDYARVCDQLMAIEGLALVVVDPLASFVQADLNKDSAAASFVAGQLTALAADTGATVLATHHMAKMGVGEQAITTPEQARRMIRGQSALVDNTRLSYALWAAAEADSRRILNALAEPSKGDSWRNRVVMGAVVKSNAPADRTVRTYVRDMKTGLLVDRTGGAIQARAAESEELQAALARAIAEAAEAGAPFTKSGANGVHERQANLPPALRVGKGRLQRLVDDLISSGQAVRCTVGKNTGFLDVPGGPFDRGEGSWSQGGLKVLEDRYKRS